jgi:tetratricopeptide (TPR) repeat protein
MRNLTKCAAFSIVFVFAASVLAQDKPADKKAPPPPPAVPGAEVLSLPGEARGDAASELQDLLKAVAERPDDPACVLAADTLGSIWELVPNGRAQVRSLLEMVTGASPIAGKATVAKVGWALDHYRGLLQELRLADGDAKGALEIAKSRGFIRHWMVVGPFGHSQRAILDEVFPPEVDARQRSIDVKARYTTVKGDVSWTKVPAHAVSPVVNFARALRATNGSCYVVAHLESPADQDVAFVYEGGAAKLFLNRALLATVDRHRQRLDPRVRAFGHLRKGWNRIVLKTGDWASSFSLRLATPEGQAVSDVKFEEELVAHDVEADADSEAPVRDSWTVEELDPKKRIYPTPDALVVGNCLHAYTLLNTNRSEEAYATLEALGAYPKNGDAEKPAKNGKPAEKKTPPPPAALASSAWFWVLAAEVAEQADHLPDANRRVEARRAYKRALEIDPDHAGARRRLAEYDLEDDKAKEGLSGLEDVIARDPADDSTRIRLFTALMDLKWEHEAEKTLAQLKDHAKDLPAVVGAEIRWTEAKSDRKSLQKLFEKQLASDKRNLWVYERRRQLALASGDEKLARESLDEEERATWESEPGEFDLKRADLARTFADSDSEIAFLKKALDARPQDLDLRERLARAYAEHMGEGDKERALALLDDLLEVEPHRLAAQNLRNALRGKPDEFWKEWEYDASALVKTAPGSEQHPDASVICLQDQTVTRIRRDGSATEVVHELWKILDDDGKEKMGNRQQTGELMQVRVFTTSGEILEPIRAQGRTFELPGLAAGSVIEHEFKLEHGPRDFQYTNGPWYFRDPDLEQPFVHSRWVVIAPKELNLEAIEKNLDTNHVKKTVVERGDEVVRIYETFDQDRIEAEPHMPPKEEFLPWVKLYEHRSLEELAGSYVDVSLGRTYVTPSIQAKADELCAALEGDSAKVKAIYSFVKEHCTHPGGGESAAQILAAKGGSKSTLMMALLDAAKVPFRYALAATSPDLDDSTDWDHPEAGQFHTPILRILPRDGAPRWVYPDGPRYVPMEMLPTGLWGAPVLICDGASARLDVLPRGAPADAGSSTRTTVELLPGGGAKAFLTQQIRQMESYGLKEVVKNMDRRQIDNFAAQAANQLFTGARLKGWETPSLEDPNVPFTISLKIEAENVVRKRADGQLTVSPGLDTSKLKQAFGGSSTRKFDLVLKGWTVTRDAVTLDLGPYACSRLPSDVQQESKYGQYSLIYVREGHKLRIERALTLFPRRVTPAEYKEFLNFIDKVDAAERRPLVVEPRVGASAEKSAGKSDDQPPKTKKDKEKDEDKDDDDH